MGGCYSKETRKDEPVHSEKPQQHPTAHVNGALPSNGDAHSKKPEESAHIANANVGAHEVNTAKSPERGSVSHSTGSVEDKYILGKELGRGGFSIVLEATDRKTNDKVAIKMIEKKHVDPEELKLLQREIDIMRRVQHRNVLRLYEIFETSTHLYLVMELVNGGELFYKIVAKGAYTEGEARDIVRQLVEGVDYLHNQGIAHRDLKPENLLCSETEEGVVIKIADFGLSKAFSGDSLLETSCGTPDYAAPEVLRMDGSYDKSVDLWSIGVITYVILCGFPPFYGKTQTMLFEKILNADFDYPDPEWTNVTEEAKDFIGKLLVLDTNKRFNTKQCLEHAWLKETTNLAVFIRSNTKYLNEYNARRKER